MRKRLSLQVSNLSDILDEVTVYLKLSFSKYNEQGGKSLVNKYLFKDTKEYMYIFDVLVCYLLPFMLK